MVIKIIFFIKMKIHLITLLAWLEINFKEEQKYINKNLGYDRPSLLANALELFSSVLSLVMNHDLKISVTFFRKTLLERFSCQSVPMMKYWANLYSSELSRFQCIYPLYSTFPVVARDR